MRRTPLRLVAPPTHTDEPGYRAWHAAVWGRCAVCDQPGRLIRHHVVLEQHVRAAGGAPYDLRNALPLGYYACSCHRDHHHAVRRLPLARVPPAAVEFAIELLGEPAAIDYLARYYRVG